MDSKHLCRLDGGISMLTFSGKEEKSQPKPSHTIP